MSQTSLLQLNLEGRQKTTKLHFNLRNKQIQNYKSYIRRENQCQQHLQNLLESLPGQLEDVLIWCREVMMHFSQSKQYRVPDYKIIELFKLIQKFPCLQTITLLYLVAHRISISAVHELFQYDIVGLLHKLIISPEKLIPRILIAKFNHTEVQTMMMEIVRKSMLVLASLAEQSQKARNFIVMSHKSYLCLAKAHSKYGSIVTKQFYLCLYSFTCHPMAYDEQFVRIIKILGETFCNKIDNLTFQQTVLIIKGLTSAVKCKQKWAMDLIQQNCQYDILDCVLKTLKKSVEAAKSELNKISQNRDGNVIKDKILMKQIGQIVHLLNIFLMNYIQVTINQYFDWQSFFTQWFNVLAVMDTSFENARRDIYFIFNNIICQAEQPQSGYHLLRNLVFQHNCIHVFAHQLDIQTNQEVQQQLSYCISSLLSLKNIHILSNDILNSNLVNTCLETVTRNFHSGNCVTKETLITAIFMLISNTQQKEVVQKYCYDVRSYKNKLEQVCLIYGKQNCLLDQAFDKLIHLVKSYY